MKRPNKFVGIAILAIGYTLIPFHSYWRAFDGAHSAMDLLWGGLVSIVLVIAIFMYFPVAKKTEYFSPAWFFMLTIAISLLTFGIGLDLLRLSIAYVAWGNYMFTFSIFIPIIHWLFRRTVNPPQKGSFFKRISFSEQEKDMA